MKNYALLVFTMLFVFTAQLSFAQEGVLMKASDDTYYFEKVYTVAGTKKEDLFKKMKGWVMKNVKTADKAYFDNEGFESINTNVIVATYNGTQTDFKMNIDIKEGKYKLSVNAIMWHNGYGQVKPLGDFSGVFVPGKHKKKIVDSFESALSDIVRSLEQSARSAGGNNW